MSTVVCWFQRTLKQLEQEHTDTDNKATTVTLAHARRGLIILLDNGDIVSESADVNFRQLLP